MIHILEVPVPEALIVIQKMTEQHYEEVPFGPYDLPMDLNIPSYHTAYEQGYCNCYIAYDDEKVVGYMSVMAVPSMHHRGTDLMVTDSFYVLPEYRGHGVFQLLLDKCVAVCKECNIAFFNVTVNPQWLDHGVLASALRRSGFDDTEYTLTKRV